MASNVYLLVEYLLFIILIGIQSQGGTLIFSHIRRLGPFFWVQNSEFQYFFGFSEKKNIFGGYEDFVDIFGVITKMG